MSKVVLTPEQVKQLERIEDTGETQGLTHLVNEIVREHLERATLVNEIVREHLERATLGWCITWLRRLRRPVAEVGRCGDQSPAWGLAGIEEPRVVTLCNLPHGHGGWHAGDDGSEWSK